LNFYGIKIQTNIKKNLVEKYMKNYNFKKGFFLKKFWVGPNYLSWARIGPAMNSGFPLFTCYVNSGGWQRRRRRKKREAGELTCGGLCGGSWWC